MASQHRERNLCHFTHYVTPLPMSQGTSFMPPKLAAVRSKTQNGWDWSVFLGAEPSGLRGSTRSCSLQRHGGDLVSGQLGLSVLRHPTAKRTGAPSPMLRPLPAHRSPALLRSPCQEATTDRGSATVLSLNSCDRPASPSFRASGHL